MNKYSLKAHLRSELDAFASTLKDTSYDDANQQYVCHDVSTPDVYDFDAYVKARCSDSTPASPDAIHIGHKVLYFVEFKNQSSGAVDKEQVKRKFVSGTAILKNLLGGFGAKYCKYHFYVVFKNQPKPRIGMDARHIQNNVLRYRLAELNQQLGGFYDRVVTESVDFFANESKGLQCA